MPPAGEDDGRCTTATPGLRADWLSLIQTSFSWPPLGARFHGGRFARSRFRSSQAASWAESQTTASTRAVRATIGARWRRSRRSPQYETTRRRRLTARPRYSIRPPASLNRYTPGAAGSRSASSRVSSNQIHNHSLERTVVSPAPHSNPPGGADATAEPPQSLRSERQ